MRGRGGVLLVAVLCLAAGYAARVALEPAETAPPSYLEQLTRDLDLRPDQVAAIDALLAREDRDLEAAVAGHREALSEQVAARRQETEDAVLALLDEGQLETYRALTAR
jgi:hypothetical protein